MKEYIFSIPLTHGRRLHYIEAKTPAEALKKLIEEIVDPSMTLEEAKGFSLEWRLERVTEK